MNKITVSISFVFLLLGMSCSERKEDINGYWISADYSLDREFTTLLIADSILVKNPFGIDKWEYFIKHEDTINKVLYPFDDWSTEGIFSIRNDTIIYIEESQQDTLKYIRFFPEALAVDLTFSEYPIQISLPNMIEGKYISFDNIPLMEPLFIGKLKRGNQAKYLEINSDSILIQHFDTFITLNQIPKWIENAKAKLYVLDRDKTVVALFADSSTPESFIEKIKIIAEENSLDTILAFVDPSSNKIYFKVLNLTSNI